MLYSILIYGDESVIGAFSDEDEAKAIAQHQALRARHRESGTLGPVARLMPTSTAVTVHSGASGSLITDGPFAETKEQLLGFYVLDCATLEAAIEAARSLPHEVNRIEVRPIGWFDGGV